MKNKKLGVSAVIGVILMVVITVAIAATVYVYVSGILDHSEIQTIEGTITDKFIGSPYLGKLQYWFVTDGTLEVDVDIEIYYDYDIGDHYKNIII